MNRQTVRTPHSSTGGDPVAMFYRRIDMGDATTLEIKGVLDALSTVDLRPLIDALVAERRRPVTVDLSSLRLIDS
jgi:anti-sigma B factor antagonist